MNEKTQQLFKQLTEFPAAPGFERELRALVKEKMSAFTQEFVQDRLGSLFGVLRGDEQGPRVMVAGHFDEVGFITTGISDNGMVSFQPLGGWWSQAVLAQRLQIVTPKGKIVGVVGSTPPHLLDEAQRGKPVDLKAMYLDIGADSREEAEAAGVQIGQQILPICEFTPLVNPKKSWPKPGTTGTASVWRSSCWKLCMGKNCPTCCTAEPMCRRNWVRGERARRPI